MEKRSLLKKYDIPISHLDFGYIEKCRNSKEMERIVTILRSGEEGYYPDLTKCAEEKLRELKPDSSVLRKEERVLTKNSLSQEEWEEHSAPIIEWSTDIKSKDAILSTIQESSNKPADEGIAPIRKSSRMTTTKEKTANEIKKASNNDKNTRPAATNYRQWDKYDADAEMLKMDLEEERVKEHVERMNKINKEISAKMKAIEEEKSNMYSKLTLIEREKLSEDYKIRGNECFKSKEYTEALQHYSKCIQILPTAAIYNNKAITNIKLQRYTDAVADCDECLQRDPNNLKALLRKAVALLGLGKKIDAYQVYEHVKSIDSDNVTACKALEDLRNELGEVAPLHATRIKIVENEDATEEPKSVVNQPPSVSPKPKLIISPPAVEYDLAELVKPNRVVKSKLAKTMESLGKMATNKDDKAKQMPERIAKLQPKGSNPEIRLPLEDPTTDDRKGKCLIQEL